MRWEVLAAINEIETDYGRNLNVSSAGALGWMQFMPPTWEAYGVDANRDGLKDPFNPVDAIFAAARYLRAAGAETDIRKAIFAYNHADWYVDSVLMRARLIGGLPSNFVGSLTGLTQGRFPVHAKATYAGQIKKGDAKRKTKVGANAAVVVEANQNRRGIEIFARRGAPVVAVNDGRIVRTGETERLGKYIQMQDTYGNTYTYGRLGSIPKTYPAPKPRKTTKAKIARELKLPKADAKPTGPASATARTARATPRATQRSRRTKARAVRTTTASVLPAAMPAKQRLFALPSRPNAMAAGGEAQLGEAAFVQSESAPIGLNAKDFIKKPLKKGSRVVAGTILGRIGKVSATEDPHVLFELRPAGRGAPRVDPKPILDGWKLLESTAIYRAKGKNPFFGEDAERPSLGQILLMGKEALSRHVLANPRIDIYSCGARDIRVRRDRPPRARHARVPRRLRPQADRHLDEVRPRLPDRLGQRVPALLRQRRRHRDGQRHPDHRPPGQGLDHRPHHPAPAHAPGHDEARPDHLPDDVRGRRQHAGDGRPRRPHPRRLEAALRHQLQGRQAGQRGAQAQPVDQADRPPEGDRQPRGQPRAVEVLREGRASRFRGAYRRVTAPGAQGSAPDARAGRRQQNTARWNGRLALFPALLRVMTKRPFGAPDRFVTATVPAGGVPASGPPRVATYAQPDTSRLKNTS